MPKHAVKLSLIAQAQICASTEQTRYCLNGVYFDAAGVIVATDGHLMSVVRPDPNNAEVSPGFFEAFKGRILATLPPAAFRTKAPGKRSTMPAYVVIDDETGALTVAYAYAAAEAATNGVTSYVHPKADPWVDGTFPDWRRVVPKEAARLPLGETLGISTLLLPRIAEFFQESKDGSPVQMFAQPNDGPIVCRSGDNSDAFLVVMPRRSGAIAQALPSWFSA